MFDTIVIGHDGSEHAERAFAVARSLAHTDSRLVVVHVVELVGGKGGMFPLAADEEDIHAKMSEEVAKLRSDGLNAELITQEVRITGPAHAIAEVAASVEADLIVVGSRGHSLPAELILGSVPARLLHIAHRPVLVVPSPSNK
jgi:nucleotide-binding universal stress UspA family protein